MSRAGVLSRFCAKQTIKFAWRESKMDEIGIQTSVGPLPKLDALGALWESLEKRSDHSFFISWAWIGCWLKTLPKDFSPLLLKAERAGQPVGLAILCMQTRPQFRIFKTPALYLNSTGDPYFDEITTEYNGFLVDRSGSANILHSMLRYLFDGDRYACNELFIDGANDLHHIADVAPAGTRVLVGRVRGCYAVDLTLLRARGQSYISSLGASRRYNIRRSVKEYTKIAPLTETIASSPDEALFFLGKLHLLHQAYWEKRGSPGAFANQFFCAFLKRLITDQFATGKIQLLRVSVGEHDIGYLLNFIHHGHVYQYQSGFNYGLCEKYNGPGYVCHMYGVERNAEIGHDKYDYMAGDSEYKKAMGTRSGQLLWQVVQKNTVTLRLERQLRRASRKLREMSPVRAQLGTR